MFRNKFYQSLHSLIVSEENVDFMNERSWKNSMDGIFLLNF